MIGVLLFGLVAVILQWRIEPSALTSKLNRKPAARPEHEMLGLVSQVIAQSNVGLDPGQGGAVHEPPGLHHPDLLIQSRVGGPHPTNAHHPLPIP